MTGWDAVSCNTEPSVLILSTELRGGRAAGSCGNAAQKSVRYDVQLGQDEEIKHGSIQGDQSKTENRNHPTWSAK